MIALTAASLADAWHTFFWRPESPTPLAHFRAALGAVLVVEAARLIRTAPKIFGATGVFPRSAYQRWRGPTRFEPLGMIDHSPAALRFVFLVHFVACVMLTFGVATRLVAALVCFNFVARSRRNHFACHGGDSVAKFLTFLLALSNAGGAFSIDALIGTPAWLGGAAEPSAPWALRLMQLHVAFLYLHTVRHKCYAPNWVDGTAAYLSFSTTIHKRPAALFVFRLLQVRIVSSIATWATLLVEWLAAAGVWIAELRLATLAATAVLHLGILVSFRMKVFQPIMIAACLLYLRDGELAAALAVVQRHL